jgi:glycosyltransferase involved in cell wall biosynthesis
MFQFSILIPTWNNLAYLQLCVESIRKNSVCKNQIIVYINEGKDGTLDWLKTQSDVDFIYSESNVGICIALNSCRSIIKAPYLVYMNDDMYVCPKWDYFLQKEIESIGHDYFMLSSTLIEPYDTFNPSYVSIVNTFGDSIETFKEDDLLKSYANFKKDDWSGSSWPASVVSLKVWDMVGGYSLEFSPGMYSDPDFSMKLWKLGVRIFKGVGNSKVYHFQSKSTKRLKKSRGSDTFLLKWGITSKTFYTHYLKMGKNYSGALQDQELTLKIRLKNMFKRAYKGFNKVSV